MATLVDTETAPLADSQNSLQLRRLLLVHGPVPSLIGRVHVLKQTPSTLGRSSTAELELTGDSRVSREHARIAPDGEVFVLHDLSSRNGTFVNGQPIQRAPLSDGDIVRVGAHLFLFQNLDEGACARLLRGVRTTVPELVGPGHRLRGVRDAIDRCGVSTATTLVVGETGVGKELVARAVHQRSGRPGPLLTVNCGALSPELIESELFGHQAGTFTGAHTARGGLFREAEGGSLFLDEIGEMPLSTQVSLLRVLATGEVRSIGSTRARRVDTRVIAATNADLAARVSEGTFRADLHSRLQASVIHVPPLRDRREDILPLLHSFLSRAGSPCTLSSEAAEALLVHAWPYNVRELEQLAGRIAPDVPEDGALHQALLPAELRGRTAQGESADIAPPSDPHGLLGIGTTAKPSPEELRRVLHHYAGNVSRTASFFGKGRRQIYRWCEEYELNPSAARPTIPPPR